MPEVSLIAHYEGFFAEATKAFQRSFQPEVVRAHFACEVYLCLMKPAPPHIMISLYLNFNS